MQQIEFDWGMSLGTRTAPDLPEPTRATVVRYMAEVLLAVVRKGAEQADPGDAPKAVGHE